MTRGALLTERQAAMRRRQQRPRKVRWGNQSGSGTTLAKRPAPRRKPGLAPEDHDRVHRRLASWKMLKGGARPAEVAARFGFRIDDVVRWIQSGCPVT
jgi:hypothetical protein